jgi:tetratricopeptide (TPR) repeat protein
MFTSSQGWRGALDGVRPQHPPGAGGQVAKMSARRTSKDTATPRAAGKAAKLIRSRERALAKYERALGLDHPDTLKSRNNVATAYEMAGLATEAIRPHQRVLADFTCVLGADDPATLTSRNNLAVAFVAAGQVKEAIPLLEATVADRKRVLGATDLSTLESRNNLAGAYRAAGKAGDALRLAEQTLADRARVLGPDAPGHAAVSQLPGADVPGRGPDSRPQLACKNRRFATSKTSR